MEALGSAAIGGEAELEFGAAFTNAVTTGRITGRNATLRFDGDGLANSGSVSITGGVNDVYGKINNTADGKIIVTGGATATFYDNIVQNGTLRVSKSGTTSSVAIFLGLLSGSGGSTGGGDMFFEGGLAPGNSPAAVTFSNNVGFSSDNTLKIELGGTTVGSQYDQVRVTGELALDGTLAVSLIDAGSGLFAPKAGDVFDILGWGSLTGTFSSTQLPALSGVLAWNTSQLYTTGVISVVLPGDFDGDGIVNAADYVVWHKGLGTTYTQSDYDVWRSHFGQTAGSGSALLSAESLSAAVPEPASIVLLIMGMFVLCSRRRGRVLSLK
jgi:hypothetical protein